VKHAGLSPEQVRRVCEFANTDAFLREFKKESGANHKVVDFDGGPADPSVVLGDLNDGGGGTVFDRGTLDYHMPPTEKHASDERAEAALTAAFGPGEAVLPFENPLADVMEFRDKAAGAYEHLSAQVSGLETAFDDLSERLYFQVKQAALGGSSLGEISQVLEVGAPSDEYMKIAFEMMTPRLLKEGVFLSIDAAVASLDKVASRRMVNREHPLVSVMTEYSECLNKLAHTRAAQAELNAAQAEATAFLKSAGREGVIIRGAKAVNDAAHKAAPHAGSAAKKLVSALVHEGAGAKAEKVVGGAVKHAPKALAALGAVEAVRRAKNNPTVNKTYHKAQAHLNPLSQDWDIETAREQGQLPPGY
jgi:hypothetical protein